MANQGKTDNLNDEGIPTFSPVSFMNNSGQNVSLIRKIVFLIPYSHIILDSHMMTQCIEVRIPGKLDEWKRILNGEFRSQNFSSI